MIEIIIDTCEQMPWHFPRDVAKTTIATLATGDYALTGDDGFAIERKSLDDFVGSIGVSARWKRLQCEMDRMAEWPARVIIVEGSFSDLVFNIQHGKVVPPTHSHFRVTPQFAVKRLAELTMRGVSVLFAENPEYAAALAAAILRERKRNIEA